VGRQRQAADAASAREVWDDIEADLKKRVTALALERTKDLGARLDSARKLVEKSEKARFDQRRKELEKAMADNQLAKLQKKCRSISSAASSFCSPTWTKTSARSSRTAGRDRVRKKHYDLVLAKLRDEETRTLKLVLPHRYRLRGEARVYPIAVEILLPPNEERSGAHDDERISLRRGVALAEPAGRPARSRRVRPTARAQRASLRPRRAAA
jgi:hypothetical protein